MENYAYEKNIVKVRTIHDAIEASVDLEDCKAEQIHGAKSVMLQMIASDDLNDRSCALTIYGSIDGSNWVELDMLIQNTSNTNDENITRVSSITVNTAEDSELIIIDPLLLGALKEIKAVPTITDSSYPAGTFTIIISAAY